MKILIGGGGTGGHIYPALALARHASKAEQAAEILFVGSVNGLERKIVPSAGFKLLTIPASGFRRSIKGIGVTIRDLFNGVNAARKIIGEFKPDVILGTGGYVAAPLVIAGVLERYPVVIHEQNALPGMTNRWMSPFVKKVCLSFEETTNRVPGRGKAVFTGNPRASEVKSVGRDEGCRRFALDPALKTILIYGGSRGALKLNQVVTTYLEKGLLPEKVNMIFVTGEIYYEEVKSNLAEVTGRVKLFPYLEDMPLALATADLALTRSGATTLAEITALGVPVILIPSPNVVNNHQYYNAKILADRGAAILIEEKDFNDERLAAEINRLLLDPGELTEMAANSKKMGLPDAADRVYRVLQEVAS
ncbi:MAG: undecaprenyldiphospho-muramoylpentapeptide beta-N-acetylglucosaminyltransferase [Bacillota bacterium]|nr:undecaprenyldiphospho-muramoylpentapeptide beta-N-acetylglucosaminyltransferase [Bacillota bacterium]